MQTFYAGLQLNNDFRNLSKGLQIRVLSSSLPLPGGGLPLSLRRGDRRGRHDCAVGRAAQTAAWRPKAPRTALRSGGMLSRRKRDEQRPRPQSGSVRRLLRVRLRELEALLSWHSFSHR
ncbi:hypothetical protein MRX96_012062 [Rhipicephalus microplus]